MDYFIGMNINPINLYLIKEDILCFYAKEKPPQNMQLYMY